MKGNLQGLSLAVPAFSNAASTRGMSKGLLCSSVPQVAAAKLRTFATLSYGAKK